MLYHFLRVVTSVRRFLVAVTEVGLPYSLITVPLLVALSPVFLLCAVLARVCFARFPRPSLRPWGAPRCGKWCCVSVKALPSVYQAGWWVWDVRPAVVRRSIGVVHCFWVFLSCPAEGGENNE